VTYTYTIHNPSDYTDDEIAEGVVFGNQLQLEVLPDDPPTPLEDALAAHRTTPERIRRWAVRARDESGQLVGAVGFRVDPEHDDNPDIMWGGPNVLADHRRHGVGTQLLAYLVAKAQVEGRTRLVGGTNDRLPAGAAFAEALGAQAKQAMHMNHLIIDEMEPGLMERWVAEAPGRAADYEVFGWEGPVPEEHMQNYLDIVLVMNTAPRDDLEMNDFTITAQQIREGEKQMAAIGVESWVLVARRKSDGVWAGFHDVNWVPSEPNVVYVGATGVRPEHRGHALGKWLKAAMMMKVFEQRPQVTEIRTGNADSNDAMLGINKQMGYKPMIGSTTWEIPVEKVAAWLAERGVAIPSI
jgi:GNAT superfamily N-acetyltransferase